MRKRFLQVSRGRNSALTLASDLQGAVCYLDKKRKLKWKEDYAVSELLCRFSYYADYLMRTTYWYKGRLFEREEFQLNLWERAIKKIEFIKRWVNIILRFGALERQDKQWEKVAKPLCPFVFQIFGPFFVYFVVVIRTEAGWDDLLCTFSSLAEFRSSIRGTNQ